MIDEIFKYGCSDCNYYLESQIEVVDFLRSDCPKCSKGFIMDRRTLTLWEAPLGFVKSEPKTVGHLAARNTEKMGRYEYQDKVEKGKAPVKKISEKMLQRTGGKNVERSGELPFWRSGALESIGLPKRTTPYKTEDIPKLLGDDIKINPPKPKKKRNE